MTETSLTDLRKIELKKIRGLDEKALTKHRRTIIDSSEEEKTQLQSIVSTSKIEDSEDFNYLEENFPNYLKAIWYFEKAPKDKKIEISSLEILHYHHPKLTYQLEGDLEEKSVILKKTENARIERMMAQASGILEQKTYRVLSVDGTKSGGVSKTILETGEDDENYKDFRDRKVRLSLVMPSQYAVIEFIPGKTAKDYVNKLNQLSPEEQKTFLQSFASVKAVDFLFAIGDIKLEHMIVGQDYQLTRIDREQGMHWFYQDFSIDRYLGLGSNLDIKEQKTATYQGVVAIVEAAKKNWHHIEELVRRNANFGVMDYQNKNIEPISIKKIEKQLSRLELWLNTNRPLETN